MADVQITCITLSGGSTHRHITHVGNPTANWKWRKEDVIASVDAKTNTFYVKDQKTGKTSYVGVVRESGKEPYLRTHADSSWNDNLLAQQTCPWS